LDSQIGRKNQANVPDFQMTQEFAVKVTKDAFTSAAERDIYTGDNVQIWTITKAGCSLEQYPIRRD
jgi:20S proteasome subunit beta 6